MPEGDTIHRTADRLRPALAGAELIAFDAPHLVGPRPRPGTRIESVEAIGKHLLVRFAGGLVLQTHMRMTGSWHLYRTGERWQKPAHLVRARIDVPGWVAVCFSAPMVRTYREGAAGGPIGGRGVDAVAHLGPDLCRADLSAADVEACLDRMDALVDAHAPVGPVLLDQRIACGVGNVYRSEVLWAVRVNPHAPMESLDRDTRRTLIEVASKQLRSNLGSGPRTTVEGGLAVYGRSGQSCLRCGTPVRRDRLGDHARSVYWCPTCQPVPPPPT